MFTSSSKRSAYRLVSAFSSSVPTWAVVRCGASFRVTFGRVTAAAGFFASASSRTAVSRIARRIVYAERMVDSDSPRFRSSTVHASTCDGLSLSSGVVPMGAPTMCFFAMAAYIAFVVALRSEAASVEPIQSVVNAASVTLRSFAGR